MSPRGFTHYWNRESWENPRSRGGNLKWLASSLWERAGVKPGDPIYPVTFRDGHMYLLGRMTVDRVVTRPAAIQLLGANDIWEAPLVAIGRPEGTTDLNYSRSLPLEIVRQLRFDSAGEARPLVFVGDELDQQTLRGVRRLTPESVDLLDEALTEAATGPVGSGPNRPLNPAL